MANKKNRSQPGEGTRKKLAREQAAEAALRHFEQRLLLAGRLPGCKSNLLKLSRPKKRKILQKRCGNSLSKEQVISVLLPNVLYCV